MVNFVLPVGQKFAMLVVENTYAELPEGDQILSDGTWLMTRVPISIEDHWARWIGTLRVEGMRESNLVLLRTVADGSEQYRMSDRLIKLFSLLALDGVPEYARAEAVAGTVVQNETGLQNLGRLPTFLHTKGYVRRPVDVARIEQAIKLTNALEQIEGMLPSSKFLRFMQGLKVLKDGLLQQVGQERIHQFVRSLEALILPTSGSTKRQFAHRCQTFVVAGSQSQTVLEEAFDMRSDTEHLQDWNRALRSYPVPEREDIAHQRTRQMERLATFAYARILSDRDLWKHFQDDAAQQAFWEMSENPRRTTWGNQLDISAIPMVREYDSRGRALQHE
jgi:hypothetical protein